MMPGLGALPLRRGLANLFRRDAAKLRAALSAAGLSANVFTAQQTFAEGAAVASAAGAIDIWATDGNSRHITGNAGPITSFGTAPQAGARMLLVFDGTPTLTQSADLNLNGGGADIVIAAGDMAVVYADTTTQMDVFVIRKSGAAVVAATTPITKSYSSGNQTITSGGLLTLAHGMGAVPRIVIVWLVCTTAELGYSINDRTLVVYASSVAQQGASVDPDATNIEIRMGSDASSFRILNKSTGTTAGITNANWRLLVEAFA